MVKGWRGCDECAGMVKISDRCQRDDDSAGGHAWTWWRKSEVASDQDDGSARQVEHQEMKRCDGGVGSSQLHFEVLAQSVGRSRSGACH